MTHQENTPDAPTPEDDYGLDGELEQLRAAMASLREEALRERAELDNQRKRLARDVDQARRFANEKLLSQLLPVLDSLDAGLLAASAETGPLKDGLEMTLRQLLKVGADNGMTQLDPIGVAFDPEWHQAISQIPASGAEPGTVVQVFQKGYSLNDRLLRPALVVVAAG
ncbi:MAG: nucleotide exchange factor GrpE [Arenimonas sp.]|nr:nucleotide exchange factor GrpE [Arenimonas sp.]